MEQHTDAIIYFLLISVAITAAMFFFSFDENTFWGNVAMIWVGFIIVYALARYRKPIYNFI